MTLVPILSIMMAVAPHQYVAIAGATLIDVSKEGSAQTDVKDSVVLIADGRIVAIGDRKQVRLPSGTKLVDAANRFVIPGLIDGFGAVRTERFADAYLYEGVTTVIVPTAPKGANVDGESAVVAPEDGLEAHRRGLAVTAQLAFTNYPYGVNAGVDAFVRNDKYSLTLSRPQDFLAYADDPMGAGGSAAARAVCSPETPDPTAFGSQLQNSYTALMPTLSMEATADDVGGPNPWSMRAAAFVVPSDLDDPVDPNTGARPYLDSHPERRDRIQTCARRKQEIDRRLHALGAVYLAGTATPAYGVMPGGGLHGELRLLQGIGLTPREALAAATRNIADAFRLDDRGKLEAGRRADLVILSADPRIDIAAVDAISEVMVQGKFVDREQLMDRAVGRRHAASKGGEGTHVQQKKD